MKFISILVFSTIYVCSGIIIEQCDYNFFLTSDKKICQDDICTKEFFGLFTLDKGSRICLIRNDGSRLSFSLQSISMHYYYKDYYYACIPAMKVSTEYKCINSDNCNAEMCKPTVLSSGPGTLPRSTNSTDFFYTGCIYQGWCTGWCFYDLNDRCGWGLVEVIPQTCYKILRRERSEWIAEIVYEDSEVRNTIYLSQSNPVITKPFAMTINSMILQSEPIQNSRYLLEVTPILYRYVQACEKNFPVTGMIGDYQQSLDHITTTYPLNNIQCRGASCEIACTIPTSPISRYLNSSSLNTKLEDIPYVISRPDLKSLEVRREVEAHLTLTAVTGDVKNLKVVSPNCKISSIYTMGCTGCFESSIVGLLASDMKNPGIVTVESN
ncbi:uncharacterized protein isoform X1 [Leptinotarsa decemlineata]|uniref:uncharacterized protein isoform X1 n=1 Tax=Leptinotarsa decemlineata TaxID=7539 RepID=UPI003D30C7AC